MLDIQRLLKCQSLNFLDSFVCHAKVAFKLLIIFLFLLAHYNDVCDSAFSSLQDISRTDLPSASPKVRRL